MKITKSIKFTKAKLESIKHTDKVQQFFDLSCEGLSLHVQPKPSLTKSYYASWGVKATGPDGKQKTSGRRRYICRFNQKPLDVVKRLINIKLPEWKKLNETSGGQTIETLVKDYISNGAGGYRIKAKGAKLKYKDKTTDHYKQLLECYVLGKTEKQELLDTLNNSYKLAENNYYKKSLPKILLKDISRSDVQIWHQKLEQRPTAANKALAALSIVFEWDSLKLKPMFKGVNPCLRIAKYQETKDKKFIDDYEKVTNIIKYTEEQQWRDPHFLTFYRSLMEEGERIEDHYGLLWKKPINKTDEKECTGWIDFRSKTLFLKDTKNREPAEVELTDEMITMFQKLQNLVSEENSNASFAVGSKWVFPRPTDPTKHINENSYRVKLRNFHFKMGLTTREYVRGKGKRKVYKYTNHLTLKHLRKTFVTYYGRDKGLEAASFRMRHSSMEVTKNHYYNEKQEDLKTKHSIYKPAANVIDLKKAGNDQE
jgi:integrase